MAEGTAGCIPKRVFINSVDSYASRNIAKVSLVTKMKDRIMKIWTRRDGSLIYLNISTNHRFNPNKNFLTRYVT